MTQRAPCWVGVRPFGWVTDADSEGTSVTVDGQTLPCDGFASGEPDGLPGDADCVELGDGGWADVPCTAKRPLVCECPG